MGEAVGGLVQRSTPLGGRCALYVQPPLRLPQGSLDKRARHRPSLCLAPSAIQLPRVALALGEQHAGMELTWSADDRQRIPMRTTLWPESFQTSRMRTEVDAVQ